MNESGVSRTEIKGPLAKARTAVVEGRASSRGMSMVRERRRDNPLNDRDEVPYEVKGRAVRSMWC